MDTPLSVPRNRRRTPCVILTKLIPLKILVFLMNGANGALYPFFTIHMLAVGLTLTETGLIFALIPFVGCIFSPLFGMIADKIGDYKKVVVFLILFSVLSHGLLGFAVPKYSVRKISYPVTVSTIPVSVWCDSLTLTPDDKHSFAVSGGIAPEVLDRSLTLSGCSAECGETKMMVCRSLSKLDRKCLFASSLNGLTYDSLHVEADATSAVIKRFDLESMDKWYTTIPNCNSFGNFTSNMEQLCAIKCQGKFDAAIRMTQKETVITGDRRITLALYTVFRVLGAVAVSSAMQLLDASTFMMAKQHHGDFGVQRTFGLFGSLVMPPLTGYLIGVATVRSGFQDYSPAFYLFCTMFTLGAIITLLMDLQMKPPAKELCCTVLKFAINPRIFVFIIVVFLLGCCYGALENYLFWFMQEHLGSPKWLLGLTNTVAGVAGFFVVLLSTLVIIKYFGHNKIFIMAFLVYGVRFLAYSFVYKAWLILPVEILEAVTFSLAWVTAVDYCEKLAPDKLASLLGIIGSAHYSLGRGIGALIAGVLFDRYKARLIYQCLAGASFAAGILYAVLYYALIKRLPKLAVRKVDFAETQDAAKGELLPHGYPKQPAVESSTREHVTPFS